MATWARRLIHRVARALQKNFLAGRVLGGMPVDSTGMDADGSLEERLRELGRTPIDGPTRSRTLTAMASVEPRRRWSRGAVAAAAVAGFFAGSLGLASAGALPAPAQDAAHNVLSHVGVDVPPGHQRYNDPTVCPGGPYENHGAYVRSHKDDPNAGASPCGKPVQAVNHSNGSDASEAPESESDDAGGSHGNDKGKDKAKGHDEGEDESSAASDTAGTLSPAVPTTVPETTSVPAPTSEPPSASSQSEQSSSASSGDATGS